MPASQDLTPEWLNGIRVGRYRVVSEIPSHHARQPITLDRDGLVPASHDFGSHLYQLRPHSLADRAAHQEKAPRPGLAAHVREAQDVERRGGSRGAGKAANDVARAKSAS